MSDSVKTPSARACLLCLISTHIDKVRNLAVDLLRKIAKTYCTENDLVKLQALNLAAKLWASSEDHRQGKSSLLIKYIFQLGYLIECLCENYNRLTLARYDRSYDIRDRCRFLRNFLFLEKSSFFPLEIFLAEKPAPVLQDHFGGREHFQLGTLSNILNQKCAGYNPLPDFPLEQPDPSIRRDAHPLPEETAKNEISTENINSADELFSDEDEEEKSEEEEDEEEEEDDEEDEEEEEEVDDNDAGSI